VLLYATDTHVLFLTFIKARNKSILLFKDAGAGFGVGAKIVRDTYLHQIHSQSVYESYHIFVLLFFVYF
jgi:hypothetical protein